MRWRVWIRRGFQPWRIGFSEHVAMRLEMRGQRPDRRHAQHRAPGRTHGGAVDSQAVTFEIESGRDGRESASRLALA
ncbi:hypothetical protein VB636_02840 [Paracoccus sp. APAP_BH8]